MPGSLAIGSSITAPLTYFGGTQNGEKSYILQYKHDVLPPNNFTQDKVEVPIRDLRPSLADPELRKQISTDSTGFAYVDPDLAKTEMEYKDWENEEKIQGHYYNEVTELLKKVTGGSRVIIFDHTIRRGDPPGVTTPDTAQSRKPVQGVHVDQTPLSGSRRVIRHAKEQGLDGEQLLRGRVQLINVWRPLRAPARDMPLAFCDSRTVDKERDLVYSRLLYPPPGQPGHQVEGETFNVKHNEKHDWYYVPDMGPQEVLLLKCWDNTSDTLTPHTAFAHPEYYGKEDVPPRQSIEIRALVFHPPEE